MKRIIALLVLSAAGPAWAGSGFSEEQLKADFYYDLGPKEAEVSAYPEVQKRNYHAFLQACSQCHSAARPLNSPIVERADWKRYVTRMHMKDKARGGTGFFKEDAKAIVDFLAYDSQIRKVADKAAFDAKTKELKGLFAQVRRERERVMIEDDKKKAGRREQRPMSGIK